MHGPGQPARAYRTQEARTKPHQRAPAGPEVTSPLYQHQQEALAWMVGRENSNALPPFWEASAASGTVIYKSTAANYETEQRPESLRCAA